MRTIFNHRRILETDQPLPDIKSRKEYELYCTLRNNKEVDVLQDKMVENEEMGSHPGVHVMKEATYKPVHQAKSYFVSHMKIVEQ